jgi:hypothetical protein
MRGCACLLVFAACQRGGLTIDVVATDPRIDEVRLYVGRGAPATDALSPPNASIDEVTYWSRDPGNELDHVTISSGEKARFVLVRTDTERVPAIIAVGYANKEPVATGSLFDLFIPTDTYAMYSIELAAPVTPLDQTSPHQVGAWSPDASVPMSDAACIGVLREHPSYPHAFIVTDGDPDCDDLPTGATDECMPMAYLSSRPAARDELRCLTPGVGSPTTCWLGGPACVDGQPRDNAACEPSRYCTPHSVCTTCGSNLDCASDLTAGMGGLVGHYSCAVYTRPDGQLCQNDLVLPSLATDAVRCSSVALRGAGGAFDDHLEIGGMKFDISVDPGCVVTMKPSGMASPPQNAGGVFAVDLDDGRGLASPIIFEVKASACTSGPVACRANNLVAWPTSCTRPPMPWGPPTLVPLTPNMLGFDDPTLRGDLLEIYVNDASDVAIYRAVRTSQTATWSLLEPVTELGAINITSTPEVTPDGLTMYFNSTRSGGAGGADIFVTTRTASAGPWQTPGRIAELATQYNDYGATTDEPQLRMIFNSDRFGPDYDLFETTRASVSDPWGAPVMLSVLSSPVDEINPFLSTDGLTVYFSSNRLATEGHELYVATRSSTTAPFGSPVRINELGTPQNDVDPWVSQDGRTMFFASDRSGTYQIYQTRR